MIGYVLVRLQKRDLVDTHLALARIPQVREVHPLVGEWDLLAKVVTEPALPGADLLFTISGVPGVMETKWLGISRIGLDARVASDLSNTPTRSDAL